MVYVLDVMGTFGLGKAGLSLGGVSRLETHSQMALQILSDVL